MSKTYRLLFYTVCVSESSECSAPSVKSLFSQKEQQKGFHQPGAQW